MNEINFDEKLATLKNHFNTEIRMANKYRDKSLQELNAGHVWPSTYVNLMKANVALRIYGNLIAQIENCEVEEGLQAEQTLNRISRTAQRNALSSHRINSTCNVVVEVETIERMEWVSVYNVILTGSEYGI
jgi:hypothetical protein